MYPQHRLPRAVGLAALTLAIASPAALAVTGTPTLDLRLRHERVDDAAFARDAEATTLRVRLGYRLQFDPVWSVYAEAEHTASVAGEKFNSSANGRTAYPLVADPDNTELNQAFLRYAPREGSQATLGRQRLSYDNHRFFGNVGWRQNEQTFDAFDLQHRLGNGLTLRYSWLDRVQRVFGDDHPNRLQARWKLDTHLLSAALPLGPGTLGIYAHFIENESLPLTSHRNLGLRYSAQGKTGDMLGWQATAEYARQRPHADGAAVNRAEYLLTEGALIWRGHTFQLGFEQLSGDGRYGFATPFATLHAFNGWADRFLATPADGLRDVYLGWKRGFGPWTAQVVWHDFSADRGGAGYGREWDASLGRVFGKGWSGLLKFASYDSRGFGTDVDKLWLSVEYRY